MRILLAIDGSEQSRAAVDEVAQLRFPADSAVRVISVVGPPEFRATFGAEGLDASLYLNLEAAAREQARAAVENAAATLQMNGQSGRVNVTTEVISGSPKRAILEDAETFGADLIVVGSHGHGMIERFLLGSVAQAVALHAKCSVEIVRSPHTQTREGTSQ